MKIATTLTLALVTSAHAWKNPSPKASNVAKGVATTAAATAAVASAANAATTATTIPALKVDVDAPVLFDIVKDEMNQDKMVFYAECIQNLFGPAFEFELPSTELSNLKELGLQLAKGSASVIINGQTVGVQVVKSEQGALTVQLQQQYLPKIPFLGLEEGGSIPTIVAPVPVETVATATPPVEDVVSTAVTTAATTVVPATPFWDVPLFDGSLRLDVDIPFLLSLHKAITPLDVAGTTFAGLGGVYAFAFAFYKFNNWQQAQASAAKKAKAAAAREKKAAAAKKAAAEKAAAAVVAAEELDLPEKKMTEDATKKDEPEADAPKKKRLFSRSK